MGAVLSCLVLSINTGDTDRVLLWQRSAQLLLQHVRRKELNSVAGRLRPRIPRNSRLVHIGVYQPVPPCL